jgi:thymidylate synthase
VHTGSPATQIARRAYVPNDDGVTRRLERRSQIIMSAFATASPNPQLAAWLRSGLPMRLALDEPSVLRSRTIGESWLAVAGRIVASGWPSVYDGLPIRELSMITLQIARPDPDDAIIAKHADPERLAWMHANFTDHERVASLGDADSYATRLFDYERSGRDQVRWVIDRLRAEPSSRSATITTFQPHTDTTYIPCVSMLDFWLPDGALELVVYAHSIDFGAKGYGNLVELASLQRHVADELGVPVGRMLMIVKSAHVYEAELCYIEGVLVGRST